MGLVFASRRTQILDLARIWSILEEDGYAEIPNEDGVTIGDVAVYARGSVCEHVGLVIAPPAPPLGLPRVLSKFGWAIEAVHFAHDGPYQDCSRRYFRMRNYDIPDTA